MVELAGATRTVEAQYSTVELLEHEREILAVAAGLRGAQRALARDDAVSAALQRRPFLSAEQRELVARLTTEGDGVAIVVGRAGAGKTTALAAACEAWRAAGIPVVGVAVARRAAKELSDRAGIKSTSVEAFLRRPQTAPARRRPPRRRGKHAQHPPFRPATRPRPSRRGQARRGRRSVAAAVDRGRRRAQVAVPAHGPDRPERQPPPARRMGTQRRRPHFAPAPRPRRWRSTPRTTGCTSARPTTRSSRRSSTVGADSTRPSTRSSSPTAAATSPTSTVAPAPY